MATSSIRKLDPEQQFGSQRGVRFSSSDFPSDIHYLGSSMVAATSPAHQVDDSASSSEDSQQSGTQMPTEYGDLDVDEEAVIVGDGVSPIHNGSYSSWSPGPTRPPNGRSLPYNLDTGRMSPESVVERSRRPPAPPRNPSSTYNPQRHPHPATHAGDRGRHRSSSANRLRRDPNALYRSQEKAYVQRLRQDPGSDYFSPMTSYQPELEMMDDESPSSEVHLGDDPYDADTLLLYGHDDVEPSLEELQIPQNRERLEWHSMLATVMTGDVVTQEKKRLIGNIEEKEGVLMKTELFIGLRAKVCGRSPPAQRRLLEEGQSKIDSLIDEIIHFEIQGKDKTDKSPREQVQDIIQRWEKCEMLWPTHRAMIEANPSCASPAFVASWDAIVAWNNITELINTELEVLQGWVGNRDLDFGRQNINSANDVSSIDRESSFLDRILKEDNFKSLIGKSTILIGLSSVVGKAKATLIEFAEAFEKRFLPPYVEELLVLIGFPTRLIEEVIGMRLKYAERMREPMAMMTDQLIMQFQSILQLAVKIKQEYTVISEPEPGWDPPPCMDENFEQVVLDGLIYYFKLIGWRIGSNKNTFKEAEILETEWNFSNNIGQYIEGGDVKVAEQFRYARSPVKFDLDRF